MSRYQPNIRAAALGAVLCSLLSLCAAACGPFAPAPVSASFAGPLAGTEAFLVIVTDGAELRAYVCDGVSGQPLQTSEWFKGIINGSSFTLSSLSGGARLSAQLTAADARGSVKLADGRNITFQIGAVSGEAGFYLYKETTSGVEYRAGWIVLPDRQQRGSMVINGKGGVGHSALDSRALSASLPNLGTVRPAALTPSNVALGFSGGCFPCKR